MYLDTGLRIIGYPDMTSHVMKSQRQPFQLIINCHATSTYSQASSKRFESLFPPFMKH